MGAHINPAGQFQSDRYPTCPPGKVPLSVKDPTAQDLLWMYAQRRRVVDAEFSADLETALAAAGFSCAGCTVGDGIYDHTCSRSGDSVVVALDLSRREIEFLRAAVKTLGSNCDEETGNPDGTFSGQQFAAIDRALGR